MQTIFYLCQPAAGKLRLKVQSRYRSRTTWLLARMTRYDEDIRDALVHLAGQLASGQQGPETRGISPNAVRQYVTAQVSRLLDKNPALLMSILYRVDVAESEVKRVFNECGPDRIAPELADLLIKRQLQKIQSRKTHRQTYEL